MEAAASESRSALRETEVTLRLESSSSDRCARSRTDGTCAHTGAAADKRTENRRRRPSIMPASSGYRSGCILDARQDQLARALRGKGPRVEVSLAADAFETAQPIGLLALL